jgi:hypothetical protein
VAEFDVFAEPDPLQAGQQAYQQASGEFPMLAVTAPRQAPVRAAPSPAIPQSLSEDLVARRKQAMSEIFAKERNAPWQKFKEAWRRGSIYNDFQKTEAGFASAFAASPGDPDLRQAYNAFNQIRDVVEQAHGKNPNEFESKAWNTVLQATESLPIMAKSALYSFAGDIALTGLLAAVAAIEPTPLGEAATVAKATSLFARMQAAAKWGKQGLGAARATRWAASTLPGTLPMYYEGKAEIHRMGKKSGLRDEVLAPYANIGGLAYAVTEGIISPLRAVGMGEAGVVTKGIKALLDKGAKRATMRAVNEVGLALLQRWAGEDLEEAVQGGIVTLSNYLAAKSQQSPEDARIVNIVAEEISKTLADPSALSMDGGPEIASAWDAFIKPAVAAGKQALGVTGVLAAVGLPGTALGAARTQSRIADLDAKAKALGLDTEPLMRGKSDAVRQLGLERAIEKQQRIVDEADALKKEQIAADEAAQQQRAEAASAEEDKLLVLAMDKTIRAKHGKETVSDLEERQAASSVDRAAAEVAESERKAAVDEAYNNTREVMKAIYRTEAPEGMDADKYADRKWALEEKRVLQESEDEAKRETVRQQIFEKEEALRAKGFDLTTIPEAPEGEDKLAWRMTKLDEAEAQAKKDANTATTATRSAQKQAETQQKAREALLVYNRMEKLRQDAKNRSTYPVSSFNDEERAIIEKMFPGVRVLDKTHRNTIKSLADKVKATTTVNAPGTSQVRAELDEREAARKTLESLYNAEREATEAEKPAIQKEIQDHIAYMEQRGFVQPEVAPEQAEAQAQQAAQVTPQQDLDSLPSGTLTGRLQTPERAVGRRVDSAYVASEINRIARLTGVRARRVADAGVVVDQNNIRVETARDGADKGSSVSIAKDGRVYVRINLDSATTTTVGHEWLRHIGLAGQTNGNLNALIKHFKLEGHDLSTQSGRLRAEEALAETLDRVSEGEIKTPRVRAIINAIKQFIAAVARSLGIEWNPADPIATLRNIEAGRAAIEVLSGRAGVAAPAIRLQEATGEEAVLRNRKTGKSVKIKGLTYTGGRTEPMVAQYVVDDEGARGLIPMNDPDWTTGEAEQKAERVGATTEEDFARISAEMNELNKRLTAARAVDDKALIGEIQDEIAELETEYENMRGSEVRSAEQLDAEQVKSAVAYQRKHKTNIVPMKLIRSARRLLERALASRSTLSASDYEARLAEIRERISSGNLAMIEKVDVPVGSRPYARPGSPEAAAQARERAYSKDRVMQATALAERIAWIEDAMAMHDSGDRFPLHRRALRPEPKSYAEWADELASLRSAYASILEQAAGDELVELYDQAISSAQRVQGGKARRNVMDRVKKILDEAQTRYKAITETQEYKDAARAGGNQEILQRARSILADAHLRALEAQAGTRDIAAIERATKGLDPSEVVTIEIGRRTGYRVGVLGRRKVMRPEAEWQKPGSGVSVTKAVWEWRNIVDRMLAEPEFGELKRLFEAIRETDNPEERAALQAKVGAMLGARDPTTKEVIIGSVDANGKLLRERMTDAAGTSLRLRALEGIALSDILEIGGNRRDMSLDAVDSRLETLIPNATVRRAIARFVSQAQIARSYGAAAAKQARFMIDNFLRRKVETLIGAKAEKETDAAYASRVDEGLREYFVKYFSKELTQGTVATFRANYNRFLDEAASAVAQADGIEINEVNDIIRNVAKRSNGGKGLTEKEHNNLRANVWAAISGAIGDDVKQTASVERGQEMGVEVAKTAQLEQEGFDRGTMIAEGRDVKVSRASGIATGITEGTLDRGEQAGYLPPEQSRKTEAVDLLLSNMDTRGIESISDAAQAVVTQEIEAIAKEERDDNEQDNEWMRSLVAAIEMKGREIRRSGIPKEPNLLQRLYLRAERRAQRQIVARMSEAAERNDIRDLQFAVDSTRRLLQSGALTDKAEIAEAQRRHATATQQLTNALISTIGREPFAKRSRAAILMSVIDRSVASGRPVMDLMRDRIDYLVSRGSRRLSVAERNELAALQRLSFEATEPAVERAIEALRQERIDSQKRSPISSRARVEIGTTQSADRLGRLAAARVAAEEEAEARDRALLAELAPLAERAKRSGRTTLVEVIDEIARMERALALGEDPNATRAARAAAYAEEDQRRLENIALTPSERMQRQAARETGSAVLTGDGDVSRGMARLAALRQLRNIIAEPRNAERIATLERLVEQNPNIARARYQEMPVDEAGVQIDSIMRRTLNEALEAVRQLEAPRFRSVSGNGKATVGHVSDFASDLARRNGGTWTRMRARTGDIGTLRIGRLQVRFRWGKAVDPKTGQTGEAMVEQGVAGDYVVTIDPDTGSIIAAPHEIGHIAFDSTNDAERKVLSDILGYDVTTREGQERFVLEIEDEGRRGALADRILAADPARRGFFMRVLNRIGRMIRSFLGTPYHEAVSTHAALATSLRDFSILSRWNAGGEQMSTRLSSDAVTTEATPNVRLRATESAKTFDEAASILRDRGISNLRAAWIADGKPGKLTDWAINKANEAPKNEIKEILREALPSRRIGGMAGNIITRQISKLHAHVGINPIMAARRISKPLMEALRDDGYVASTRAAQVEKKAQEVIESKEFGRLFRESNPYDTAQMKDSESHSFKTDRRSVMYLNGLIKQAKLREALPWVKRDGEAGLKAFIKEVERTKGKATAKHVAMSLRGFFYKTDASGRQVFDANHKQVFKLSRPGLIKPMLNARYMFTAQDLLDQVDRATDARMRAFIDSPLVRKVFDDAGEAQLRERDRKAGKVVPEGRHPDMIENYFPQIRDFTDEATAERMARNGETEGPSYSWHPAGLELNQDLDVTTESNKKRQFSTAGFVVMGIDDLIYRHVQDAARFVGYSAMADKYKEALSDPSIRANMDEHHPNTWNKLYEAIAALEGPTQRPGELDSLFNSVLGRSAKLFTQSMRVIAYQPWSYIMYSPRYGFARTNGAVPKVVTPEGRRIIEMVTGGGAGSSLWLRYHHAAFERTYLDESPFANRMAAATGARKTGALGAVRHANQWIADSFVRALSRSDRLAINIGAIAAFEHFKALNPGKSDAEIAEMAARDLSMATLESQTSTNPLYMTSARRSTRTLDKVLSFMSGSTSATYNQFVRTLWDIRENPASQEAWQQFSKTAVAMVLQALAIAGMRFIASGRPSGDDDDEKEGRELREFTYNTVESLVSVLPLGQSLLSPEVMKQIAIVFNHPDMRRRFGFLADKSVADIPTEAIGDIGGAWERMLRAKFDTSLSERERKRTMEAAVNRLQRGAARLSDLATGINLFGNMRLIEGTIGTWSQRLE